MIKCFKTNMVIRPLYHLVSSTLIINSLYLLFISCPFFYVKPGHSLHGVYLIILFWPVFLVYLNFQFLSQSFQSVNLDFKRLLLNEGYMLYIQE